MWAVYSKEVRTFFSTSVGILALLVFLIALGLFVWVLPNTSVFTYGAASLERFFEVLPYLLLFFIPSITMNTFAEEYRAGTLELLLSKPLSLWQLVGAKFMAVCSIYSVSLLLTAPYIWSIWFLSQPTPIDWGALIGSYIGVLSIGITFAALGLLVAAVSMHQISAFLIASFLSFALFTGFHYLAQVPTLDSQLSFFIQKLGLQFHYDYLSRGVLDTRNIAYFLFISYGCLLITTKSIQKK